MSVDGEPAPAPEPVHGRRDPEPGRVRGHLPAARGPARPVPPQGRAAPARRGPTRCRCCGGTPSGFDPRDLRAAGIRPVAAVADLDAGVAAVREVSVSDEVAAYVVDIARATRVSPSLALGVSPRGATALMATSRAWAWLAGRTYVTPDDVKALAHATLAHRALAAPGGRARGRRRGRGARQRARVGARPALMAITWRTVVLALAGLVPVALWPQASTVRWWALVVRPARRRSTSSSRAGRPCCTSPGANRPQVRLGEATTSTLWVTNTSDRGVRGLLRDAWPPSAGARRRRARPRGARRTNGCASRPTSCPPAAATASPTG